MTDLELLKQTLDKLGATYSYQEEEEGWGLEEIESEDGWWEVPTVKEIAIGCSYFYFDRETEKFIAWFDGEFNGLHKREKRQ